MSAVGLMTDLAALGIELQAHGDRIRYSPRSAATPDLVQQIKGHKPALLAILAGVEHWPEVTPEANERNWNLIDDVDRDYLLGPRDQTEPCAWCGGRLIHSTACAELRDTWVPLIPFGKHRGRRADELPADYIEWIIKHEAGDNQFRDELLRWRQGEGNGLTDSPRTNATSDP